MALEATSLVLQTRRRLAVVQIREQHLQIRGEEVVLRHDVDEEVLGNFGEVIVEHRYELIVEVWVFREGVVARTQQCHKSLPLLESFVDLADEERHESELYFAEHRHIAALEGRIEEMGQTEGCVHVVLSDLLRCRAFWILSRAELTETDLASRDGLDRGKTVFVDVTVRLRLGGRLPRFRVAALRLHLHHGAYPATGRLQAFDQLASDVIGQRYPLLVTETEYNITRVEIYSP